MIEDTESRHVLAAGAVIVGALMALFLIGLMFPAPDLPRSLGQTTMYAAVSLASMALLSQLPYAASFFRLRNGFSGDDQEKGAGEGSAGDGPMKYVAMPALSAACVSSDRVGASSVRFWTALLVCSAAVFGALFAFVIGFEGAPQGSVAVGRIGLVVAVCAMTGIFEETMFRGVLLQVFRLSGSTLFMAAMGSSLVFGLLHLSIGDMYAAQGVAAWVQVVAKPVQAVAFGFACSALLLRTKALVVPVIAHMLFDIFYMGPTLFITGHLQTTYVSGIQADAAVLVASTLVVVVCAWRLWMLVERQ